MSHRNIFPSSTDPTVPRDRPSRPARHKLLPGLLLVALVATATVALNTPTQPSADAAMNVNVTRTDGQGVRARSEPRVVDNDGYGAPEGAPVAVECYLWGDAVGPANNRLWWRTLLRDGRRIMIADRYLTTPNAANQPPPGQPACGSIAPVPPPAPGADPVVWVGSPVDGTWDLPAASGGDGPAVHWWMSQAPDRGDFAVDLPAPAGQAVHLYAAPKDGRTAVTTRIDKIGPACGGGLNGGQYVTVGLYAAGKRVGSATYGHIRLAAGLTQGQTVPRWGTVLGTVGGGYPVNANCWTGPHIHQQLYSTRTYACFNKGFALGQAIHKTNFIGFTSGGSTYRKPCA